MNRDEASPCSPKRFRSSVCLSTRRGGFTIVELAATSVCLAVVAAVLSAVPPGARQRARLSDCLNNLRSLGQAAQVFALNHGNLLQIAADQQGVEIADPDGDLYAYGGGEILAWPVALAQAEGLDYEYNWDWGVRADSFADALQRRAFMADDFEIATCPSDRVQTSTPYYPQGTAGLQGSGDPTSPLSPTDSTAYWGKLSFAMNEDIIGVEGMSEQGTPGCWRRVECADDWCDCRGGFHYPPSRPCGGDYGWRLRGNLDQVFEPASVALFVEAGPNNGADVQPSADSDYANLILSTRAQGPCLGDAQQQWPGRIPTNRHLMGRINVLFADLHAQAVRPVEYDADNGLPSKYRPQVRISPYDPHGACDGLGSLSWQGETSMSH